MHELKKAIEGVLNAELLSDSYDSSEYTRALLCPPIDHLRKVYEAVKEKL